MLLPCSFAIQEILKSVSEAKTPKFLQQFYIRKLHDSYWYNDQTDINHNN